MCGRFTLTAKMNDVTAAFDAATRDTAPPRYNIAPTQPIAVITEEFSKRKLHLMRWGFIPGWVKEPENFTLIINARSETVAEKPSFRAAIRHRRCIIPATGFYEWHREGTRKTPYFLRPKSGGVIGFAGIYETYAAANGSEIDTVCFMTTAASPDIAAIHHRMPVPVAPDKIDLWLDCVNHGPQDLLPIYESGSGGFYDIIPVSDRVNAARHDDPSLQEPISRTDQVVPEKAKASDQLSLF